MLKKQSMRRILFTGFLLILVFCVLRLSGQNAQAEDAAGPADQNLVIEVVEDIPAEEIEEQAVPLAALPDSPRRTGLRHALLGGIFIACLIGYLLYFRRYQKRLHALRETAAQYGYELLNSRRRPL